LQTEEVGIEVFEISLEAFALDVAFIVGLRFDTGAETVDIPGYEL
jgi:hypothetical protein